ncbi:MAG TPA: cytochrome c-type biogenesis protein CcmH [Polyangiaceae bacterium]|nr:cytochrome c-type biogenesis protein CcmH [Polyangiaceae bacterium]
MKRISATLAALFFAGSFAVAASAQEPAAHDHEASTSVNFDKYVPGAAELEGRIIAPCCWTQTIEIHGSPASTELRQEIRQRLTAGETPDAIERSLVQRYGPKILAVPPGSRLPSVGIGLGLVVIGAGIGALTLLKRWQRRATPALADGPKLEPGAADAELDARVDAELSRLDRE